MRGYMRWTMTAALVAAGLAGCMTPPRTDETAGRAAIAAVVAAEAQFAAEADAIGIVPAFRKFVGPEAIMFLPRATVINSRLADANWPGALDWRPSFAVASAGGDMVLTTGPSNWVTDGKPDYGYYFTIWTKQLDGGWKFALDGSTPMGADLGSANGEAPEAIVNPGVVARPDAYLAWEADYARRSLRDAGGSLRASLDARGRVLRKQVEPMIGPGALGAVAVPADAISYKVLGGRASAMGDLAYVYGEAQWTAGTGSQQASFVRVWRNTGSGPRILLDQLGLL